MTAKMKSMKPGKPDEAFRTDMLKVLDKHAGALPQDRILALCAYTLGQIIALQDQRKYTSEMVMQMVSANIQAGNQHAIEQVASAGGSKN